MAIQPCSTCGRAVESDEYWPHNVACDAPVCQAEKLEREQLAGIRYEQLPDGCTRVHLL